MLFPCASLCKPLQWKVLVYDRKCRDIISPLLNVSKLRKRGVTLHLLLEADREDIPDVPAVYFIEATEENIQRVSEDVAKRLYSAVYLNFVSKVDRPLMERLAKNTIASNTYSLVTKVFDQYLDFVTLEPRLFTLNQPVRETERVILYVFICPLCATRDCHLTDTTLS